MRVVRSLLLACHPLPTLAVTLLTGILAARVGLTPWTLALVVAGVLTGQLSIGWHNDLLDADRDRAAGRTDKPAAAGDVGRPVLRVATASALLATIGCSVLLGVPAGVAALTVVGCGWAYNLGLRATAWSPLPYLVAFGMLPAVPARALPGWPWPAWWAIVAGASLGVAAHLLNVLPDLDDDVRNGIRGLPHRMGARVSVVVATVLVLAAGAVLLLGPSATVTWWRWLGLAVLVAAAGAVTVRTVRAAPDRTSFRLLAAAAVLDVLLLAVSGTSIVPG